MGWVNVDIETPPELEELRQSLPQIAHEIANKREFLVDVSHLYEQFAEEAFDDAKAQALSPATIARRRYQRLRKRKHRRREILRTLNWKAGDKGLKGIAPQGAPPLNARPGGGLFKALTAPIESVPQDGFGEYSLRKIWGDTLEWGSRGIIDYASFHVQGTKRMRGRLSGLDLEKHRAEFESRVRDVMAEWVVAALEKANPKPPFDWIQAVVEGRG